MIVRIPTFFIGYGVYVILSGKPCDGAFRKIRKHTLLHWIIWESYFFFFRLHGILSVVFVPNNLIRSVENEFYRSVLKNRAFRYNDASAVGEIKSAEEKSVGYIHTLNKRISDF